MYVQGALGMGCPRVGQEEAGGGGARAGQGRPGSDPMTFLQWYGLVFGIYHYSLL